MALAAAAPAAHHASPLTVAALICAFSLFHVVKVLVSPTKVCPRCKGQRMLHHGTRVSKCPRCQVKGRVPRLGAQWIHRQVHDTAGDAIRARFRPTPPATTPDRSE